MCCLALISTSLFTGCSGKNNNTTGGNVTFKLSDNQPEDYVTVKADKEFARIVKEKTNGRIKIEVYPGGQLGDEKSVIEQLQFGGIDAIRVGIGPLTGFNKEIGVLILPYIYRDTNHMFKVLDGPIGDKMFKSLENNKIVGLCWFDSGARNFYNTKKDVKTPDDLKGLKIRVQESPLMMNLVKVLGASPTPMAYGEVYSALQSGVIDGAENNWPSYLTTNQYEIAKHITVDEHSRIPEMIAFSKMSMDKLSADDQKILRDAAKEAAKYERTEWIKTENDAKQKIIEKGVTITKVDDIKAFQDKVKPLYSEFNKETVDSIINTK